VIVEAGKEILGMRFGIRLLILVILVGARWIDVRSQEVFISPHCPAIYVSCPDTSPDSPLTFNAQVSGVDPSAKLTFKWTVLAGVIVSGQGTASITVDTTEASGQTVKASVEVWGLPNQCSKTASCSTDVIRDPLPQKIDEYGVISFGGEKVRLDLLAAEMRKDSNAQGYILSYAGRRARASEAQWRAERAKLYLVRKWGLDPRRIVAIDGGHKETRAIELYIVPLGVTPPPTSPTVEPDEVKIVGRRRKRSVRP
jgi:hypothetical protein